MNNTINDLTYCIFVTTNQEDIVPCMERYLLVSKNIFPVSMENIFVLRDKIVTICKEKQFNLNFIFLRLWWNRNLILNKIGSFIMPLVFSKPDEEVISSITNAAWRIDDIELANYFSYNLSQIIINKLDKWEKLLFNLFSSDNLWTNYSAANTLLLLSQNDLNSVPAILKIINEIKGDFDLETKKLIITIYENISHHLNISTIQLKTNNYSHKITLKP